MKNISGWNAVVTGASSGIGKAIAEALANAGCQVALLARPSERLEQAAETIRQSDGKAQAFGCDLSHTDQLLATLPNIEASFGPIDILVNNVGSGTFKPMHHMSAEEATAPVELPFKAAIAACQALAPKMRARKRGHIVNLTSPAGYFPLPYMVPYTAARYAMVGMSLSLYEELVREGVGVSLICPAQVNTGYFEREDADLDWYPRISKMFPVLEPQDVADKVILAIRKNKRELIFPFVLWPSIRGFQKAPGLSLALLKALGLWYPSRSLS